MISIRFFKNRRFLPLLALPFLVWLVPSEPQGEADFSPEKINLALRRTADGLLRQAGDSTSRIPAVEQHAENVWRVRLEQPFEYGQLPPLLEASLDLHGIRRAYEVAVRRCDDGTIDIGYHQLDFLENNDLSADNQRSTVPCGGREMPDGCHFVEITFLENEGQKLFWAGKSWIFLLVLGGLAGFWLARRQKSLPTKSANEGETSWLEFGNSRLDVAGQILICGSGDRQNLTFRETKLLRLFATSPDRLLERDEILRQVWADEGILVGRSVDVFVSRLRKKLAADPSVGIAAVHGVGYRLETGKSG